MRINSLSNLLDSGIKREYEEDLYKVKYAPKKDDLKNLKKLKKALDYYSGGGKVRYSNSFDKSAKKRNQRVTFKAHRCKSLSAHSKYITQYMPQNNKKEVENKPELFGTPINEYMENMDNYAWQFIISPENQNIDLKVLTDGFIKRIENMTGYKLYWQASIHDNTEHRHVHVCINGKDKKGSIVKFQREWIKRDFRGSLSDLATVMMGERSDFELQAEKKKEVTQRRFTIMDEEFEKYPEAINRRLCSTEQINRLIFLTELGLCEKDENFFKLKKDWKNVLQANGRFNTFYENWHELNGNLELYKGGVLKGHIIKTITFNKDEAWNDAIIISDGQNNFYVPFHDLTGKEDIAGKKVIISGGTGGLTRQLGLKNIKIIDNGEQKRNSKMDFN